MNLLREYIRELLTESAIDPKIMSMIDKAEHHRFIVRLEGGLVTIEHPDWHDNKIASVSWDFNNTNGYCLGAMQVSGAQADQKYRLGPLAYDIAVEASGGLMSDRTEVSGDAERVWDYYWRQRKDVQVDQLDITKDFGEPQLTPDKKKDDCGQVPAYDQYGEFWPDTGLSKKVSKAGTPVIDELRKRGMIQE